MYLQYSFIYVCKTRQYSVFLTPTVHLTVSVFTFNIRVKSLGISSPTIDVTVPGFASNYLSYYSGVFRSPYRVYTSVPDATIPGLSLHQTLFKVHNVFLE